MKFIRGRDPKAAMEIGLSAEAIEIDHVSILKSIDYADFGESWNWKGLSSKRAHKILAKMAEGGRLRKDYHFIPCRTHEVMAYGDDYPYFAKLAGKAIKYEDKYYIINQIYEFK